MRIGNNSKTTLAMVCAALSIAGIMVLAEHGKDSKALSKGVEDFNTMEAVDFEDDTFVKGTILELDQEFAYMEEYSTAYGIKVGKERITEHYYIMPLASSMLSASEESDVKYIGVCLTRSEDIAKAEQMLNETWEWWDTGEEPDVWTSIDLACAKVEPMDGELLDYFYEGIMYTYDDEGGSRSKYSGQVVPYIISFYNPDAINTKFNAGIVLFLVGLVPLLIMAAYWFKSRNAAPAYPTTSYSGGTYTPVNGTQNGMNSFSGGQGSTSGSFDSSMGSFNSNSGSFNSSTGRTRTPESVGFGSMERLGSPAAGSTDNGGRVNDATGGNYSGMEELDTSTLRIWTDDEDSGNSL